MKNKNRFFLLLIFLIIVSLGVVSFKGVPFVPGYKEPFSGNLLSYKNIEKGLDLSGGVYIVYEAQEELKEENKEEDKLNEETSSEEASSEKETSTEENAKEKEEKLEEPKWEDKMNSAISLIQQRLDRQGWTEANVYQEGSKRIRVEIPGVANVEEAVDKIGKTAKLSFVDIEGNILVEGKDVINAFKSVQTNSYGVQEIVVNLEFNEKGKKDFADATANNIGNPLLITLDDTIISAPNVNTAITDGKAVISGNFDADSAEELASLIRAGALPFELKILEMNTVGATLGANALKTSILGGAIGLALVLIFMIVFYRMNGFVANLALIVYILVELILLNFFNITLTLHGIAGIILSIGMAVDANVIIFERIREELNSGRTIKLAISKGFSRALAAILDSNITTLIAGGVLYWLGTGPIKGFAQTLMIGIVISMFTALFVTRVILNVMVGAGFKNPKLYGGR